MVGFINVSQVCDRLGQLLPFRALCLEQASASGREVVVLARRPVARFLPGGLDDTFSLQPAQQRIQRAFGGRQRFSELGKRGREFVTVTGSLGDELEYAELNDATSRLSQPVAPVHVHTSSVPQGTLYRTVVYP